MNKLIIFIASLRNGGAERVVSILSQSMLIYFKEVEIITYYDADIFYKIDNRVKVVSLESITGTTSIIRNCHALRKYLDGAKPSVLISFMAPFNILALLSVRHKRNYPIIVADRSDPRFECRNVVRRFMRSFLYSTEADKLVIQSKRNLKYYPKNVQGKSSVIFNPISIDAVCSGVATLSHKEKLIVQVASLVEVKNQRMLIQSFSNVVKNHPEYRLIIYGEGPCRGGLEKLISDLKLENKVFLPGRINDVVSCIKQAELFVLSSNFEGLSNAMLEALYIGLPVVATDVSGAVDIIRNGYNGYLVPVGDEKEMTKAICEVIEDNSLREKMADNATLVKDLLDKDAVTSEWLKVIKECMYNG